MKSTTENALSMITDGSSSDMEQLGEDVDADVEDWTANKVPP